MEFYVPSTLVWFAAGGAVVFVVCVALFAALVWLAMWAKARREREPELEVKNFLYVNGNTGSDANDGRSPSAAMATVSAAVGVATENDHIILFGYADEELRKNERE